MISWRRLGWWGRTGRVRPPCGSICLRTSGRSRRSAIAPGSVGERCCDGEAAFDGDVAARAVEAGYDDLAAIERTAGWKESMRLPPCIYVPLSARRLCALPTWSGAYSELRAARRSGNSIAQDLRNVNSYFLKINILLKKLKYGARRLRCWRRGLWKNEIGRNSSCGCPPGLVRCVKNGDGLLQPALVAQERSQAGNGKALALVGLVAVVEGRPQP